MALEDRGVHKPPVDIRGSHPRMQTPRHPWIIRSLPTLDSTPGNDQRPHQRGRMHSSSRSPHRVPSWLSPESPPPTESGLGTRLCYEHNIDEPHGRAGKSESLSPQSALVPQRPAIKRKSKNKPASKKLIRNELGCLWQKELLGFLWDLKKNIQINLFTKQKQTHKHRKQTYDHQGEMRGGIN